MNRFYASLALLCASALFAPQSGQAEAPYNVAWSRQIGTTIDDLGLGVAVDAVGNAYISGITGGSLGGPNAGSTDAFLTKYNGAGNLLWSRQIGTTSEDTSYGVAVDPTGNAYITGFTLGSLGGPSAGFTDAFLTKYDGAGSLVWSRQIGTTNHDWSYGAVAVDAAGNAYVSGETYGSLGGPNAGIKDAFLTKYSSSGTLQWSRQIGTTDDDSSFGVAVDAAGNAYISGFTGGSLGGPNAGFADAFLTKYNSAGSLQWSRQIGTTGQDISNGVAVDAAGNAYINGTTDGSLAGPNAGFGDAFLTKYDGAGNLLWSRQFGTTDDDNCFGLAIDGLGNAYMSGFTTGNLGGPNAGGSDSFLTKYDGAGNLLWSRQIGTTATDASLGVAVDAVGNAFISGYTDGSLGGVNAGGNDAFLVKFAIPEPSAMLLLCLGSLIVLLRR